MLLYHFTSGIHLPWILESRFLKTTDSILSPDDPDASPPCVWLLDTPDLNGHDHGLGGSIAFKSEFRFTVEVPESRVVKWVDWAEVNGIDPRWFSTMVEVGGGREAAEHWRCVFRRIPADQWVAIDRKVGNGWVPVTIDDFASK